MKIKIKIKNLISLTILTLFIIFIIVPIFTLEIGKYLDRKGSDKAVKFYESYLSKAIRPSNEEALYRYANNQIDGLSNYKIMFNASGSGSNTTPENMENAKNALEKILKNNSAKKENNKYFSLAYSKIMDLSISTGEYEELLRWINWGKNSENRDIEYISTLYEAYYLFINKEYDLANKVLEDYDNSEYKVDYRYYIVKGDIALFQGDYDLAEKSYEYTTSVDWGYDNTLFGSSNSTRRKFKLQEYEDTLKGKYKVRGKVTFDGKPMAFVEIYAQEDRGGYLSDSMDYVGITDINGEYETLGLKPGKYEIGIGANSSLLYDKVYLKQNISFLELDKDMEFNHKFTSPMKILSPKSGSTLKSDKLTVEWEPVAGADYYNIQTIVFFDQAERMGGSFRYPIINKSGNYDVNGTKSEFDLNTLRNSMGGLSFEGEEMILNPIGVLGSFLPGFEYPIVVNAYDNNKNLIGSSLPVNSYYDEFPSVIIEGSLSYGEKLILDKKYEEAIKYYEDILVKNPDNEEALVYLSKIYMIGWKKDAKDIYKAIEYANRYKELKGDNSLLFKTTGHMNHGEHRKNENLAREVLNQVPESERNTSYYYELGRFNLSIGDYALAREAFENMKGYSPTDLLLYLDLYFGDFSSALSRLDKEYNYLYRMNKSILKRSISNLKKEDLITEDYKLFKGLLQEVLSEDLDNNQGRDLYNSIYNKIINLNIKAILNEIKREMYWDRAY